MKIAIVILAVLGALAAGAQAAPIDLTGDVWNVEGVDIAGNDHAGSTLVFETQVADGADYDLTGFFDWIAVGPSCGVSGCSGRELFTGTLFSDLSFELTGFDHVDPVNIVLGFYTAVVTADGLNIINGEWDGAFDPAVPSNDWSASRAGVSEVPLPAAAPLFASVLAGAFGWGAARRRAARSQGAD